MAAGKLSEVASIKSRANAFMKSGKYLDAIVDYTQAIAIQPSNPILYTNRSLAFLKLSQYFFAIKDAETAINLVPDWAKGYYRKGQAEYGAESYHLAVATFQKGLEMCQEADILTKALEDAKKKVKEHRAARRRTMRRYIFFSCLACSLLVLGDMVAHPYESLIRTPLVRPLVIGFSAGFGYLVGISVLSFQQATKDSLLDPPPELLQECNSQTDVTLKRVSSNFNATAKPPPPFKTKVY